MMLKLAAQVLKVYRESNFDMVKVKQWCDTTDVMDHSGGYTTVTRYFPLLLNLIESLTDIVTTLYEASCKYQNSHSGCALRLKHDYDVALSKYGFLDYECTGSFTMMPAVRSQLRYIQSQLINF